MYSLDYARMRKTLKLFARKAKQAYVKEMMLNEAYSPSDTVMRLRAAAEEMNRDGALGVVDLALALKPDLVLTDRDKDYITNGPSDHPPLKPCQVIKVRKTSGLVSQFFMITGPNKALYLAPKSKNGGHIQDFYAGDEPILAENDEINMALNSLYLTLEAQRFLRNQIDLALSQATPEDSEDLISFEEWYSTTIEGEGTPSA